MTTMLDVARAYIEKGWSVIPISKDNKTPAVKWAVYQERLATDEELIEWFKHGDVNIGIVTGSVSGLIVVDCDDKEAAIEVSAKGYYTPVAVKTRRGKHLYFQHPKVEVRNSAGSFAGVDHIDIRGDGGYVVVPPSRFGEFQYTWDCAQDDDDIPPFKVSAFVERIEQTTEGFSFSQLDLTGITSYGQSTWERMESKVERLGRKLKDGDGRNNDLTSYIGECLASQMSEAEIRSAVSLFQEEFFYEALPHPEVETCIRSILQADKRQHPERHETPDDIKEGLISAQSWKRKLQSTEIEYLMEPYIPKGSIIQTVGFNGHGKSLWLMYAMWAMSKGVSFGTGLVRRKIPCLYLDFEMSADLMAARFMNCEEMLGDMSDSFYARIQSIEKVEMNLMEKSGTDLLERLLNATKPECVVIDTCRSAWQGFEENSPHGWSRINRLAKVIRDAGSTVILVHHRNKPSKDGLGREAGSTAQLTDIDTQIIVTRVCETKDDAKEIAGIADETTRVVDSDGLSRTVYSYFRMMAPHNAVIKTVFQLSFGKLRTVTENHKAGYIGLGYDAVSEKPIVMHTPLAWDKARRMVGAGMSCMDVALKLGAPVSSIKRWVE